VSLPVCITKYQRRALHNAKGHGEPIGKTNITDTHLSLGLLGTRAGLTLAIILVRRCEVGAFRLLNASEFEHMRDLSLPKPQLDHIAHTSILF
jgi:hypothetical protein